MIDSSQNIRAFHLGRAPYRHTGWLAWLLICASLLGAALSIFAGIQFWPTYTHEFTPYLKWQDALLAILWYLSFILVGSSILVGRFLFALRAGYRYGMFVLEEQRLTVRDLSPKNLGSIYWMVGTAFSCFLAALVGLVPEILLGWTLHLPNLLLVILTTAAAIALSLAGLAVTAVAVSFIIIGIVGSFSFGRNLGAQQTYSLTGQTVLRIDGFVLTIIYPDQPESMFDLNLLDSGDQRRLLYLLRERWLEAARPWNPRLGEEIAEALQEAERYSLLSV